MIVFLVELPRAADDVRRPPPPLPPAASDAPPPVNAGGPGELLRICGVLLRGGVPPQPAAFIAVQLTGAPLTSVREALQQLQLTRGHGDAAATAKAAPGGHHTLHLANLGANMNMNRLTLFLAEVGTPSGNISIGKNRRGEVVAFVRFPSPHAAAAARTRINLARIDLGAEKPVFAMWSRRDRWID
eukprot:NODE_19351_length_847_cov_2.926389.p2 GENE.NODE_19351_length_847_cov_2.926389~~NODE_19351_length_847_cov_2.926389.p2  ORF type:complete len:186 (-),score=48.42 NODE_19351_length_847_cov_2.926389:74-631(-)